MSAMTPRDRVLAALNRQIPDRVPKDLADGLTDPAFEMFRERTGSNDPESYFGIEVRQVELECREGDRYHFSSFLGPLPASAWVSEWGYARYPGALGPSFVFPLANIRSPRELDHYPFPDFKEEWRHNRLKRQIEDIHNRDLAVAACCGPTTIELAMWLRGIQQFLIDLAANQEFAICLLEKLTEIRSYMAGVYAAAGADVLMLSDDVATQRGMMLNPATWRSLLKPCLARIIAEARRAAPDLLVLFHSDGNCEAIIPELIEIGVSVLNPVQPECMDPAHLKRLYGSDLAFWGTLGIQTTLPFGSPDDVKAEVKKRIEIVGDGGGLLIGPTHRIQADVPWENLVAFFEAVEHYGTYDV
jgi:uroporphyrinogen decarboxylase